MSVTATSSIVVAGTSITLSNLGYSSPVWVPIAFGVGAAAIAGSIVRSFFGGLLNILFGV